MTFVKPTKSCLSSPREGMEEHWMIRDALAGQLIAGEEGEGRTSAERDSVKLEVGDKHSAASVAIGICSNPEKDENVEVNSVNVEAVDASSVYGGVEGKANSDLRWWRTGNDECGETLPNESDLSFNVSRTVCDRSKDVGLDNPLVVCDRCEDVGLDTPLGVCDRNKDVDLYTPLYVCDRSKDVGVNTPLGICDKSRGEYFNKTSGVGDTKDAILDSDLCQLPKLSFKMRYPKSHQSSATQPSPTTPLPSLSQPTALTPSTSATTTPTSREISHLDKSPPPSTSLKSSDHNSNIHPPELTTGKNDERAQPYNTYFGNDNTENSSITNYRLKTLRARVVATRHEHTNCERTTRDSNIQSSTLGAAALESPLSAVSDSCDTGFSTLEFASGNNYNSSLVGEKNSPVTCGDLNIFKSVLSDECFLCTERGDVDSFIKQSRGEPKCDIYSSEIYLSACGDKCDIPPACDNSAHICSDDSSSPVNQQLEPSLSFEESPDLSELQLLRPSPCSNAQGDDLSTETATESLLQHRRPQGIINSGVPLDQQCNVPAEEPEASRLSSSFFTDLQQNPLSLSSPSSSPYPAPSSNLPVPISSLILSSSPSFSSSPPNVTLIPFPTTSPSNLTFHPSLPLSSLTSPSCSSPPSQPATTTSTALIHPLKPTLSLNLPSLSSSSSSPNPVPSNKLPCCHSSSLNSPENKIHPSQNSTTFTLTSSLNDKHLCDSPQDSHILSKEPPQDSQIISGEPLQYSQILSGEPPQDSHILSREPPQDSQILSGEPPQDSQILSGEPPQDSQILSGEPLQDSHTLSREPPQNPYTHSVESHQNPYTHSGEPHQSPYTHSGEPHQNPYTHSVESHQNPYTHSGEPHQSPYTHSGEPHQNPYTHSGEPHQSPYTHSGEPHQSPYTHSGEPHQNQHTQSELDLSDPNRSSNSGLNGSQKIVSQTSACTTLETNIASLQTRYQHDSLHETRPRVLDFAVDSTYDVTSLFPKTQQFSRHQSSLEWEESCEPTSFECETTFSEDPHETADYVSVEPTPTTSNCDRRLLCDTSEVVIDSLLDSRDYDSDLQCIGLHNSLEPEFPGETAEGGDKVNNEITFNLSSIIVSNFKIDPNSNYFGANEDEARYNNIKGVVLAAEHETDSAEDSRDKTVHPDGDLSHFGEFYREDCLQNKTEEKDNNDYSCGVYQVETEYVSYQSAQPVQSQAIQNQPVQSQPTQKHPVQRAASSLRLEAPFIHITRASTADNSSDSVGEHSSSVSSSVEASTAGKSPKSRGSFFNGLRRLSKEKNYFLRVDQTYVNHSDNHSDNKSEPTTRNSGRRINTSNRRKLKVEFDVMEADGDKCTVDRSQGNRGFSEGVFSIKDDVEKDVALLGEGGRRYLQPRVSLLGKPLNYKAHRRDINYRRLQARMYNFLERPKSWQSWIYHLAAFLSVLLCLTMGVMSSISEFENLLIFYAFCLEIAMLVWIMAELGLRVWSAGCRSRYQGSSGRLKFLKRPLCIIDVILTLASISTVLVGSTQEHFPQAVLSGLRFFQILRMVRMDRKGGTWRLLGSVVWAHRQELITTLYIGLLGLIFSSYFVYLAEKDEPRHENGPKSPHNNTGLKPKFSNFADAIWWGVVTLCTVGYGDVVPATWGGKVIASFSAILGISFFALPAGILGSGFALKVQQQQRQKHLNRRRVPAANLIQCLWRCYAADELSMSTATWKPHLIPHPSPPSERTFKNNASFVSRFSTRRRDRNNMAGSFNSRDAFSIQAQSPMTARHHCRRSAISASEEEVTNTLDRSHLSLAAGMLDQKFQLEPLPFRKENSVTSIGKESEEEDISPRFIQLTDQHKRAIRVIRRIRYFVSRRQFREALRPYDVKDVIEQYSAGHIDMLGRIKNLQGRLDQILGRQGSKSKDVYESKVCLASRIVKVERQVEDIESKLDMLFDMYKEDRNLLLQQLNLSQREALQGGSSYPPPPPPAPSAQFKPRPILIDKQFRSEPATPTGTGFANSSRGRGPGIRPVIQRNLSDLSQRIKKRVTYRGLAMQDPPSRAQSAANFSSSLPQSTFSLSPRMRKATSPDRISTLSVATRDESSENMIYLNDINSSYATDTNNSGRDSKFESNLSCRSVSTDSLLDEDDHYFFSSASFNAGLKVAQQMQYQSSPINSPLNLVKTLSTLSEQHSMESDTSQSCAGSNPSTPPTNRDSAESAKNSPPTNKNAAECASITHSTNRNAAESASSELSCSTIQSKESSHDKDVLSDIKHSPKLEKSASPRTNRRLHRPIIRLPSAPALITSSHNFSIIGQPKDSPSPKSLIPPSIFPANHTNSNVNIQATDTTKLCNVEEDTTESEQTGVTNCSCTATDLSQ